MSTGFKNFPLCLFCNHVFDGGGGCFVCFQQAVGVYVQRGACFSVAQAGGNCLCILVTGNQQCGRCVSQSMKWDHGQLVRSFLVCIVVGQNVMQCAVGGGVAHHFPVGLGEYPVVPLPIGPDFLTVAGLLIFLHQQIQTSPQQSHGILLQYP